MASSSAIKTITLRLPRDIAERITALAVLRGTTVTEQIREAVDHALRDAAANGARSQVAAALAAIDAEAQAKRDALTWLRGDAPVADAGAAHHQDGAYGDAADADHDAADNDNADHDADDVDDDVDEDY